MILELAMPYAPVVVVVILWAVMRPVRHLLHPVPVGTRPAPRRSFFPQVTGRRRPVARRRVAA